MIRSVKVLSAVLFAVSALGEVRASLSQKHPNGECPTLCSTSPLSPASDCCMNVHIDIGLLYQQPIAGYMFAGIVRDDLFDDAAIGDTTYYIDTGTDIRPCYDYAIGVTASLGYLLKHDNWYLGAKFDWVESRLHSWYDVTMSPSKTIRVTYPYAGASGLPGDIIAMNALDDQVYKELEYTGKISFFELDVLLNRGSYHSSCFSYEPFAGVKAIWLYTSQKANYFGENGAFTGFYFPVQHNWAAGPMFGVNAEYHVAGWLSIFSDADVGVLYGQADLTVDVEALAYTNDNLTNDRHSTLYRNEGCMIYVPIRTILGLKFSRYYLEDTQYLAIKLGYDLRAIMAYQETDRGVYLNGLYANFIWNF